MHGQISLIKDAANLVLGHRALPPLISSMAYSKRPFIVVEPVERTDVSVDIDMDKYRPYPMTITHEGE